MESTLTLFCYFIIIFVAVLIVIIKNVKSPVSFLQDAIDESELKTRPILTKYLIFDRSQEGPINRLIQILPFDWWIWAVNGEVFIFSTSGYECKPGTQAVVKVPSTPDNSLFKVYCINVLLQDLKKLFTAPPHVEQYSLEGVEKFTILNALNYLFTKWITMYNTGDNFKLIKHRSIKPFNNKEFDMRIVSPLQRQNAYKRLVEIKRKVRI